MDRDNNNKNKKKTVIIVAVLAVCFVAAGIFAGLTLTNDVDAKDTPELKANEVEIVNEDGEVEVVEKDSEEAVKTGERETVTTSKKTETTKASSSDKKTTSNKSNNASGSKDKNTNSSTNKDTSSSSKNDNKDSTTSKHSHSWVVVYKEVDNGYYKTVTKKEAYACCWQCGADITGNTSAHLKAHALAGDEYASWRTEYRYYDVQEWVPNVEKVVDYYKCSCGATK